MPEQTPLPWEPAVYEHKAALLAKTPGEVSRSAALLTEALLAEYDLYRADYMTVGLDVYNVEAEALGARLTVPSETACPEIAASIFDLNDLPKHLTPPAIPASGRFQLLLDAAKKAAATIGGQTHIRLAASGPVTLAVNLAGLEPVIMSLCTEDGHARRLLDFANHVIKDWLGCIRNNDLDAAVFDSMAGPPMFSPHMYETVVRPLHRDLMRTLESSGQRERELVIGGDTTPVAGMLPATGATMILCDYAAEAQAFANALPRGRSLRVRRNVDPTSLVRDDPARLADTFCRDLECFENPVAGTGILPYDFPPNAFLAFKDAVQTKFGNRQIPHTSHTPK